MILRERLNALKPFPGLSPGFKGKSEAENSPLTSLHTCFYTTETLFSDFPVLPDEQLLFPSKFVVVVKSDQLDLQ